MTYAVIEKNTVVNLIWLNPRNAAEFPNAVEVGDRSVAIGDTYKDGEFYSNGERIPGESELLADAQKALHVLLGVSRAYTETALKIRPIIEAAAQGLDDGQALQAPELFPAWKSSGAYAADDRVVYAGTLYKCLQAHTAQEDWTPGSAFSLWAKVLEPDRQTIPDWEQPESTNPYKTGDKVRHRGKTWISMIDNNVWEPGVYGWEEMSA